MCSFAIQEENQTTTKIKEQEGEFFLPVIWRGGFFKERIK